jgi:hypothetical protein
LTETVYQKLNGIGTTEAISLVSQKKKKNRRRRRRRRRRSHITEWKIPEMALRKQQSMY